MEKEKASIIESYAAKFGVSLPQTIKLGRRYFLADPRLVELRAKTGQDAFAIGIFLGEDKGKWFEPSVGFLDLLEGSPRKAVIANEAEWLYICGRDVFLKNVVSLEPEGARSGLFLVQNTRGERLGICELMEDRRGGQGTVLKNRLDIGNFLRREH